MVQDDSDIPSPYLHYILHGWTTDSLCQDSLPPSCLYHTLYRWTFDNLCWHPLLLTTFVLFSMDEHLMIFVNIHSPLPTFVDWHLTIFANIHFPFLPFFFLPWINTWQSLPTIIPSSYLCCILHGWTLDDLCRRRLRTLVLDLESCPELTPLTKCWSLDGSNRGGCRWDDHVCRREDELDLGTYSQPNRQRSICMDMEKNIYCILSSSWHPICFDVVVVDVFAVVGSNMPLITVWFFWNAT